MVSVQVRLPRLVAAVELPATSVGSVRAAGAEMLSTPPDVEPVNVWVPLAAAAGADPNMTNAPEAAMAATRLIGRRASRVGVSLDMRWCLRVWGCLPRGSGHMVTDQIGGREMRTHPISLMRPLQSV